MKRNTKRKEARFDNTECKAHQFELQGAGNRKIPQNHCKEGTEEFLVKLVGAIRARFPDVRIILRGDSDFCRESILKQCEILKINISPVCQKNPRFIVADIPAEEVEEMQENQKKST